jgi:hypothetical protein
VENYICVETNFLPLKKLSTIQTYLDGEGIIMKVPLEYDDDEPIKIFTKPTSLGNFELSQPEHR